MNRRADYALTAVVGVVVAVLIGHQLPVNYAFDPRMFVEHSLRYTDTWAFFSSSQYDQSPPLRYVPYTILLAATGATGDLAFRVAVLYASLVTFAGGALAAYYTGRTLEGRRAAWLLVAVFFATSLVWPTNRFMTAGTWQYTTTLPLVLVSLVLCHRAIHTASHRLAIGVGVVLGLLGLQQLTFAGLASLAVAGTYLRHRELKGLAATGATGALFTIPLAIAQPEQQDRATSAPVSKFLPESGGLFHSLPEFLALFQPGVILILACIGAFLVTRLARGRGVSDTGVLELFLALCIAAWAVTKFTRAQDYLIVVVLHPLVMLTVFATVVHGATLYERYNLSLVDGPDMISK